MSDKFLRKTKAQPLVPIGLIATTYFLFSGFKSFKDGNANRSQSMMRFRVAAQGVTVSLMVGYAVYNELYLKKPMDVVEREKKIMDAGKSFK